MNRDIYPEGAFTGMAGKSYRPSNGTEGDMFMARWCAECQHFDLDCGGMNCGIAMGMYHFQIGDPEYPKELVWDNSGQARCTAFVDCEDEPEEIRIYRCESTPDLFPDFVKDAPHG